MEFRYLSSKNKAFKLKEINFMSSAHITEDVEKVKTAIKNLLPENMRENAEIIETQIWGHAGNEIQLLNLTISQSKARKDVINYLVKNMEEFDRSYLYQQVDTRLDEHNCFYFRFNKQDAYNEKMLLDDKDDTIRVMMKFIVYKDEPNMIKDALEEYGLIVK